MASEGTEREPSESGECDDGRDFAFELRKKALGFWASAGRAQPSATAVMFEGGTVSGTFRGTDAQQRRFALSDARTPAFSYRYVQLRDGDVSALHLEFAP